MSYRENQSSPSFTYLKATLSYNSLVIYRGNVRCVLVQRNIEFRLDHGNAMLYYIFQCGTGYCDNVINGIYKVEMY